MNITIKKNTQQFQEVEITEPTVGDMKNILKLAKLTGRFQIDFEKLDLFDAISQLMPVALHVCGRFDGKQIPIEDCEKLPASFLLDAFRALFPGVYPSDGAPQPN